MSVGVREGPAGWVLGQAGRPRDSIVQLGQRPRPRGEIGWPGTVAGPDAGEGGRLGVWREGGRDRRTPRPAAAQPVSVEDGGALRCGTYRSATLTVTSQHPPPRVSLPLHTATHPSQVYCGTSVDKWMEAIQDWCSP